MKDFKERETYVLGELKDSAPLLALYFEEGDEARGVLFATMKQSVDFWHPIGLPGRVFDDDEGDRVVAVIGGTGHYGEFRQIVRRAEDTIQQEVQVGIYPRIDEEVRDALAGFLNYVWRTDSRAPYRVELLFVSLLGPELAMHRIKHDGDYHPTDNRFAIIGGRQTIKANEDADATMVSVRSRALDLLDSAYNEKVPDREGAEALAKLILKGLGEYDGWYADSTLDLQA